MIVEKEKKVWLITGASRGMGIAFVKAVLAAGDCVVATARNVARLNEVFGESENLLKVELDITDESSVEKAVRTALNKFNRIDILLNNAGSFLGGFFEELSVGQITRQFETNVFGTMNVTRKILPIMRNQQSGHILTITSSAGLAGFEFNDGYAASKFALEGWMESMAPEIKPFGIKSTIIEPGMFRSELLSKSSTEFGEIEVDAYKEKSSAFKDFFATNNGKQPGNPEKLAAAVLQIVALDTPPLHFVAGVDALEGVEQKLSNLKQDIETYRLLSETMGY